MLFQWIAVYRQWKLTRCQFVEVLSKARAGHTYCYTHSLLWIIAFAKIYCLFNQPHFKTKPGRYSSHPENLMAYLLEHCSQNQFARAGLLEEYELVPHSTLGLRCWGGNGTSNLTSQSCDFVAGVCSLISSFMFLLFSARIYIFHNWNCFDLHPLTKVK